MLLPPSSGAGDTRVCAPRQARGPRFCCRAWNGSVTCIQSLSVTGQRQSWPSTDPLPQHETYLSVSPELGLLLVDLEAALHLVLAPFSCFLGVVLPAQGTGGRWAHPSSRRRPLVLLRILKQPTPAPLRPTPEALPPAEETGRRNAHLCPFASPDLVLVPISKSQWKIEREGKG